jgi:hypothetical protein
MPSCRAAESDVVPEMWGRGQEFAKVLVEKHWEGIFRHLQHKAS